MDRIQIFHGDCADVLPTIGVKANLILTSPPYDNLREYGGHGFDFDRVADACVESLAEGGVLVWVVADATIDGSETGTSFRQALGFMERGLKLHDTMIYHKRNGPAGSQNRHKNSFEYMFVLSNGVPASINFIEDKPTFTMGVLPAKNRRDVDGNMKTQTNCVIPRITKRDNVWSYLVGYNHSAPDYPNAHHHPATFPLGLAKDHITTWTNPGDIVLDPMAGSGTVLRAAKDLGRTAIGIEINSEYIPIIHARLAQEVLQLAD